ncbi:hypothetical protein [Streptomyces sp. A012304]|uniref:hypothetical protein n=1 Tax=Streptomyces sp. A012304 TaxID=375446 RepID=UPI0022306B0C|nr:hypothetical protein [Streptomyces sp. A012304]GKQ35187.1 hypothetical protein ALMP_17330 [Streptomyces sp. A012304]
MKLNVGCGNHYAPGWTNLDPNPGVSVRPDIVGSLTDLPRSVVCVTAVYLGHVLEHLPYDIVVPALRGLWERCEPGAAVAVVGPDVDRARALHADGAIDQATLDGAVYGAGRWAGDVHLWECTEAALLDAAAASGLADVRPVPVDSPSLDAFPIVSRAPWQCAIHGTVPGNPTAA